jgi:hypothetical protein
MDWHDVTPADVKAAAAAASLAKWVVHQLKELKGALTQLRPASVHTASQSRLVWPAA